MKQDYYILIIGIYILFGVAFMLMGYILVDYLIERSRFVYKKEFPDQRRCKKCGSFQHKSAGNEFFTMWFGKKVVNCKCNKYLF